MKHIKSASLNKNKNLKWKLLLLIFLLIVFIINLVVVHTKRSEERKQFKKEWEIYRSSEMSSEDVNVPNFGTENIIRNLEEYAYPLLKEYTYLLEESLLEYLTAENLHLQETEIFYVMIPENDENVVYFFLSFDEQNKIVKQEFDMLAKTVTTFACEYTKEEILIEVWEGENPSERDMQE